MLTTGEILLIVFFFFCALFSNQQNEKKATNKAIKQEKDFLHTNFFHPGSLAVQDLQKRIAKKMKKKGKVFPSCGTL